MFKELLNIKLLLKAGACVVFIWLFFSFLIIALS